MSVVCGTNHNQVRSPLCPKCHKLVPFNSTSNPFEIFGLQPSFNVSPVFLENKFFELSRGVHPDKFANQEPALVLEATQWFAALSTAYSALRDPVSRAEALFQAHGFTPPSHKSQVPSELAEDYFEAKELVLSAEDEKPLRQFQGRINELLVRADNELKAAFEEFEKTHSSTWLEKAAVVLNRRSYLISMQRDLESTCQRLSAST